MYHGGCSLAGSIAVTQAQTKPPILFLNPIPAFIRKQGGKLPFQQLRIHILLYQFSDNLLIRYQID